MRTSDFIKTGLEMSRKLGLWTPELSTLAHFYRLDQLSRAQHELLERAVAPAYAIARQHPELAMFDTPASHPGELRVGTLPNGKSFHLRLDQLSQGCLVVGTTGSGKTTLLRSLAFALFIHLNLLRPRGVWLVDHQKADLEHAVALGKERGFDVAILAPHVPFNPLLPPEGVPCKSWAVKVVSILAFALQLSEVATLYLRPVLNQLYDKVRCPRWSDLVQSVKTTSGILDSVRRPLLLKLEGMAADMEGLDAGQHSLRVEELEERFVYFPLYRFPRDHARLVYAWARWASFTRRVELRQQHASPNLVVIEDEIGFAYDAASGNDFIGMLCAVQRSTGVAFIGANQTFDLLPQILANCNTKLIGRVATLTDARTSAELLTLSREQQDWHLNHPRPGQFLVKLPYGHVQPFTFTADNPPSPSLSEKARKEAEGVLFRHLNTAKSDKPAELPADSRAVLTSCHAQPFLFVTERARDCGLTNHRINRAKTDLVLRGFLEEHELDTCRRGAKPKLLEITDEGCRAAGLPLPSWTGRAGGFLHHFGKHLAAEHYRRAGYRPAFEQWIGDGCFVDVVVSSLKERVAVEVQCSTDHAAENLRKCAGKFDRVEFLCFDSPTKKALEGLLGPRIRVNHYTFYTKDLDRFQSGNGLPSEPPTAGEPE